MGAPKLEPSFFEESVGLSLIDASIKTIESYFGAKPNESPFSMAENLKVEYEVGGIIEFEADGIKVQMILAFHKELVLKIYENMLGEKVTEITADVMDCVGELTNTVYGFAKAPLVDQGHTFSLARPYSITDINTKLVNKKSLKIPFQVISKSDDFSLILSI